MAGNEYLWDTVIVAAYFNREDIIRHRLRDSVVYVSCISIGELCFGAYNSAQKAKNLKQIRDFVAINTILECNEVTGDFYGQIKQALRTKGRPIPENDIWIAATALQFGLTLISRDAHFQAVDGLLLETW